MSPASYRAAPPRVGRTRLHDPHRHTAPVVAPARQNRHVDDIELWHNPRCSKSRAAHELLGDRATTRRYLEDPPTREELEAVLVKLGTDDPRLIVRTGEPAYAGLEAADRDELLDAMVAHP